MTWILNYHPKWVDDKVQALALVDAFSLQWLGKTIETTYVGWHSTGDTWDGNLPIVLVIGGIQYEICWQNLDSLAITSNQINTDNCLCSEEFTSYQYRKNAHVSLNSALGKTIKKVSLGMYSVSGHGNVVPIINSLDIELQHGFLTIYNALDENGISDAPVNRD